MTTVPTSPLAGLMMDAPLSIGALIDHAARWHGDTEIVTREHDGRIVRSNWAQVRARSARLAHALTALGIVPGDRVATVAWNNQRHLELYYAISGIGAVCHTINPRLFPDQLAYIVNHARDRIIFIDVDLVPLAEKLAAGFPNVERYVVMTDREHLPETTLRGAIDYESLIAHHDDRFVWPLFDERTASSLCYTSGTTGNPKGALYSHRSTVLHAMSGAANHGSSGNLRTVLPVVPMFHVNAWGLPYITPILGSKLVMPGRHLDPASLYELFEREAVTFTAGVPTIWLWLLAWMREGGKAFSTLKMLGVGGSAAPPALIEAYENGLGVEVVQGWGMTETSPTCTTGRLKPRDEERADRLLLKRRAGRALFGVDFRIVDDAGRVAPDDGTTHGELQVRGNWVAAGYYEDAPATAAAITPDGWFRTGDIATLDHDGYLTIKDRAKDVIKSGGEWISSVDLENVAVGHPDVAEAAAIGVPHPTWSERPILVVVPKPGATPTRDAIVTYLTGKVAKWWLPDDVVFVEDLPHTATGKVSKRLLRERLAGYAPPGVTPG